MYCISPFSKLALSALLLIFVSACTPLQQASVAPEANELIVAEGNATDTTLADATIDNATVNDATVKTVTAETLTIDDNTSTEQSSVGDTASQSLSNSSAEATAALPENLQTTSLATAAASAFTSSTQGCPEQFYQVKLPYNGKFCQVFAADLPASMIFFVPQTPAEVIEFYQQDGAGFSASEAVKDRFIMYSNDNNTTVIISSDGQGTQVDVLVKSA